MGQGARAGAAPESAPAQVPQMLTLQEDEVEWGDGASDPALQHALAVIKAKGDSHLCTQLSQCKA